MPSDFARLGGSLALPSHHVPDFAITLREAPPVVPAARAIS